MYVAAGIRSFYILASYFLGADQRGAGNLDGNSGRPGLNFHSNFLLFLMAQNDQAQAGPDYKSEMAQFGRSTKKNGPKLLFVRFEKKSKTKKNGRKKNPSNRRPKNPWLK